MSENINKSIWNYAMEKDNQARLLTFYDVAKVLLQDLNCIVCLESSADILGYSNGGFRHQIYVYSEEDFNLPYIKCFIVKDIKSIPFIEDNGIKISPIRNAIIDMLKENETDPQVLYETFANYYCDNNNSYDGLYIPKELESKAKHYKEEGKLFYNN